MDKLNDVEVGAINKVLSPMIQNNFTYNEILKVLKLINQRTFTIMDIFKHIRSDAFRDEHKENLKKYYDMPFVIWSDLYRINQ